MPIRLPNSRYSPLPTNMRAPLTTIYVLFCSFVLHCLALPLLPHSLPAIPSYVASLASRTSASDLAGLTSSVLTKRSPLDVLEDIAWRVSSYVLTSTAKKEVHRLTNTDKYWRELNTTSNA